MIRILSISIIALFLFSCAQVVPLSGGDIDKNPPKVITQTPENNTVNFNSEVIVIKFDEYIQLKDLTNQLTISPHISVTPEINTSGKILTIKFKEKLKAYTTYKLFLGNAICDITEGNPLKDFEYSFSTGPYIDSLVLKGSLTDAYTMLPLKDAWAMLYKETDDSVVYTKRADYLARTDASGNFTFTNLPAGNFKFFALKDNNKNYQYDVGELIGFYGQQVTLPDTVPLTIRMFAEPANRTYITKTEHNQPEKVKLIFNQPPDSINNVTIHTTGNKEHLAYTYTESALMDTILVGVQKPESDSLYICVNYNNGLADSSLVVFQPEEQLRKLFDKKRWSLEIKPFPDNGTIVPYYASSVKIGSNFLIHEYNADSITIIENGKPLPIATVGLYPWSIGDVIEIKNKLKEESEYKILLYPGFIRDNYDRSHDTISFVFKTNSKSDYGTLAIHLEGLKKGNYIIQLLNSSGKVSYENYFASSGASNVLFEHLVPDNYKIRIISDTNNNKRFSGGNYLRKEQAEKVFISDQSIKIIADWDNEFNWKLKND